MKTWFIFITAVAGFGLAGCDTLGGKSKSGSNRTDSGSGGASGTDPGGTVAGQGAMGSVRTTPTGSGAGPGGR